MAVWSLGIILLLGAGFQPLQAQDDERTYYFPHLAVGASWQTTISYINYSPGEVTCQTDFLSDDGNPLMVSFAGLGTVVSRTDVLPPGGSIHEETNVDLSAPLAPGWARATCSGLVKASLLFRRRNSEGVPVAEAAINAMTVPATQFVTFAEWGEGQFGTGVAYANPSDTAAVVTFTVRDAAGQTLASADRNLPPGGHGAQNMVDLFDLTSFSGSLEVTSTEPIVSLSLNFEADPVFSSLPPGEIDTSLQGSTTYYFPHLAVGASWQTTISYINYSPGEVTCQTDFLSDDGSPLMVSFAGLWRVVSRTDVLPPAGAVHQETNVDLSAPLAPGWARATCSGPVKASILFRRHNSEGVPVAEAAVNAAPVPATRFVTFAEQGEGQFGTGVAYANPSATAAVITFTAKDVAGQTLASVTRNLPAGGHGAQNMVDLFGLTSFGGSIEVTSTEPIVSLSLNFEADPVFSSLPPGGTEPVTDREVLEALYHATNGPGWINRTNWLSTLPLSEWFGVDTNGSGRVKRLSLGRNGLSGVISPELGKLTSLQGLDFWANQLSGQIPPELGRLTQLQWVYLWGNQLSGTIPAELGELSNLQQLDLGNNELSGAIPNGLRQLSQLTKFNIQFTEVCVPAEAVFQAWLATLSDFRSSGLVCDGKRRILFLAESYNVKEGETVTVSVRLIDQTGDPVRSVTIALTATPGGGASAEDLSGVPESVTITAPMNEASFVVTAVKYDSFDPGETVVLGFRRPLPSGITAGDPATATVSIQDPGTEAMTDREVLEALYHANAGPNWRNRTNWLSDLPLSEWYGVNTDGRGRVTRLYLGQNGLAGPIPSVLGKLAYLQVLELTGNQLSGRIPPELGRLTHLLQLRLGENHLSNGIPPGLAGLTNLRQLNLRHNVLSGAIPPELGQLTQLQELDLTANRLNGAIPPELGGLTQLQELDLSDNQLSGAIPPELGGLIGLQSMNLWYNDLSGAIPPELGRLTHLQLLDLSVNRLSGAIPPELGRLTRLRSLNLSVNQSSGAIPPELAGLTQLRTLSLEGNRLNGTIPPELELLTRLEALDFSFNQELTGTIPPGLQQLPLSTLNLMATSTCVPENAGFQEWLTMIEFIPPGSICGRPASAMSEIDIAFFYTPAARRIAGGTAEMEAVIDLMIAETNQAFVESGVNQRLVLVAREEVEYVESRNHAMDLGRLRLASDGYMDVVHDIRDQAGADLVHLIASRGGVAQRAGPFGLTCAECGSRTFAHELGHNLGLSHDRYVDGSTGLFPFSYGYVNQQAFADGTPDSGRWTTIMAYEEQCAIAGFGCAPIMRFSNPDQTYLGNPLGVPGDDRTKAVTGPADAARTLNITRHSVAAFRPRASGNRLTLSSTASQARSMVRNSGPAILFPGGSLFRAIAPKLGAAASRQAGGGLDRATLRRREVTVDMGRLEGVEAGGPTALRLNLFDDVVLMGIIEQWTPTYSGGYALSGRLAGVAEGRVTLVTNGSVVAGTVRLPGATYRIRPAGAGRHAIMQVDTSLLPQGCETVSARPGGER